MSQKSTLSHLIFGNTYSHFPSSQAECVFYCCRFLSLDLKGSSQLIDEVMNAPYRGNKEADVHKIALEFNEVYAPYKKVPYLIDKREVDDFVPREYLENEFITVEANFEAYKKLFLFIQEMPKIHGGIITGNNVAIGMRKRRGILEFFDPTGDRILTKNNGHAYIKASSDPLDAATYLNLRFPSLPEGGDLLSPIKVWNFYYL